MGGSVSVGGSVGSVSGSITTVTVAVMVLPVTIVSSDAVISTPGMHTFFSFSAVVPGAMPMI